MTRPTCHPERPHQAHLLCRACYMRRYHRSPDGIAADIRYRTSPKGKATRAHVQARRVARQRYATMSPREKYLARHSRYNTSPKGRERSRRYDRSARGTIVRAQYRLKRSSETKRAEMERLCAVLDGKGKAAGLPPPAASSVINDRLHQHENHTSGSGPCQQARPRYDQNSPFHPSRHPALHQPEDRKT